MSEYQRVYGQKTILLLIALTVLNAGLFILSFGPQKDVTPAGDALDKYIEGYSEFYDSALENSESMSVLNMYRSGFAADSIQKTADSYKKLGRPEIRTGDNRGTVIFLHYRISDTLILAFMIITSVSFTAERKKGLYGMIRSTAGGRLRLYFQRIMILAFSAVLITSLVYGGNFAGMIFVSGESDLSRSIQSLPEFMKSPYSISIFGYIVRMLAVKAFVSFMTAVVFYIFISLMGTAAAYTVSAVLAVLEIALYHLIPPVSSLNILKYINVYSALRTEDYYNECRFLNIFGHAVSALKCIETVLPVTAILFVAAGAVIHGFGYVKRSEGSGKLTDIVASLREKVSFQHTLTGWEIYKLFIKQGGFFFMSAAFLLALTSASEYSYLYIDDAAQLEWYRKYSGTVTQQALEDAEQSMQKIEDQIAYYQRRTDELKSQIDDNSGSEKNDHIAEQLRIIEEGRYKAERRKNGLEPILVNMSDAMNYTKRTGHDVSIIRQTVYEVLLLSDSYSVRRASLFILIGIIGAVSGIYAYDTQNNMRNTIRTSSGGRVMIHFSKLVPVILLCVLLCTSVHLIQLYQIGKAFEFNDMDVPVQSLDFMRWFGPYITVRQYIVLLFAVRASASCLTGLLCAAVSRMCRDTSLSMGISVFILAVPAVFSQIVPGADIFSAVWLISGEYMV